MFGSGYPFGSWEDPTAYKPNPQKRSPSTLVSPTGEDWVRRPCYACERNTGVCPDCNGRQVGWQPDRPLPGGGKAHPLEGRYRRDENGQWYLGPNPDHLPAVPAPAAPTTPTKRLELPSHPTGPNDYFYGGP